MITLQFHLQPQYKYELFHIHFALLLLSFDRTEHLIVLYRLFPITKILFKVDLVHKLISCIYWYIIAVSDIATHCLPAFTPKSTSFPWLESTDTVVDGTMISKIVGPGFSCTSFACLITAYKQWDVNIVAHHLCEPKHHLIPQLVMSNNVF